MLAIVIPYYKRAFFKLALQSLADQTDQRFRVYIGDDASLENPAEILAQFSDKLDLKYRRFDDNLGSFSLANQWKRCLEMIQDEKWLMILGDDDKLDKNCVQAFYENLPSVKMAKVIRFASCKIDGSGQIISAVYQHPKCENAVDFFFRNSRSSLSEYVFRRDVVNQIGFKDLPLAWYSDILAVMEFSDFGTIFTINEAIAFIRISDLSISGDKSQGVKKLQATFGFYYYLLKYKREYFNADQQDLLFFRLNKTYIYNKKAARIFLKISGLYLRSFSGLRYLAFLKAVLKSF